MRWAVKRPSARAALRRIALPRSLAVLLAIVTIAGVAWALTVPPWQSPDELDHFAYAQTLAENHTLPGRAGHPEDSSDENVAATADGAYATAFFPSSVPPSWSPSAQATYLAMEAGPHRPSRSDGGGPSGADSNPPLYYLYADLAYLVDHGGTAFGRLYAMRLWGVLLLLATTIGAWLLAGETLGARRVPQLCAGAVAGLLPMTTFLSTSVNPDAMLIALWTLALWLAARVVNRAAPTRDALALAGVTAAAVLTKATSYALVAPAVLALLIGWWRRGAAERRQALRVPGLAAAVLAVPVLGWLALARAADRPGINSIGPTAAHPPNVGQFLDYLVQFYLPRPPFLASFKTSGGLPVYEIWLKQAIGVFGWVDVPLPGWIYPLAAVGSVGLAVACVALLARARNRRAYALLAVFGAAVIALLALLHASAYLLFIDGGGEFLQGRYLLPLVGLAGLAVALVVDRLPTRTRGIAAASVLTALLAFQVLSLATVSHAYYL
jgi:4-amino-4-deoxy-L-arabinose transferase-like glycosyltransferase